MKLIQPMGQHTHRNPYVIIILCNNFTIEFVQYLHRKGSACSFCYTHCTYNIWRVFWWFCINCARLDFDFLRLTDYEDLYGHRLTHRLERQLTRVIGSGRNPIMGTHFFFRGAVSLWSILHLSEIRLIQHAKRWCGNQTKHHVAKPNKPRYTSVVKIYNNVLYII